MLSTHRWPGNVRELRNAVQRFLITPERVLRTSPSAAESPLPRPSGEARVQPLRVARRDANDEFERSYLRALLGTTGGNALRAASLAEVSRQMIQRLLKKHGMG
jgi:DNA-binding NtrC family response regulator